MMLSLSVWKSSQKLLAKMYRNDPSQVDRWAKGMIKQGFDRNHIYSLIHVVKVKMELGTL
jgi:hypothetical protein